MFKKSIGVVLVATFMICNSVTMSKAITNSEVASESGYEEVQQENIVLDGNHYEYIRYCRNIKEKTIRIMSLKTKEDALIIPSEIGEERVVEVGMHSEEIQGRFIGGDSSTDSFLPWQMKRGKILKKIIVSEGIQKIIGDAFCNTESTCIELPKSLKSIGEDEVLSRCFQYSKIKQVIIRGKNTNICGYVFKESELEKITLPKNYQGKIGSKAFEGSKLEKFTWPAYKSGVTKKIDVCAFKNCKNLKEVIFPKNQKHIYIPEACFFGCKKLKKLTFPASTKKVTYRWNPYGDNYKMGPGTLVFKGKKTGIAGTIFETGKKRTLLTVGKIIAPKNSKAIKYAKKAKRIKTVAKKTQKDIWAHRGPTVNFIEEGSDSSKLAKMRYSILKK